MTLDVHATSKSFLVIDDFDNARKSIRGMLLKMGVGDVVEARDANSAYRAMKERYFDVILCDYNLGDGKDGQQLLESVRSEGTISFKTIYVMITAETTKSMVMGAVEYEPDDYMAKPFAFDSLIKRLDRWIKRQDAVAPVLKALDLHDDDAVVSVSQAIMQEMPRYRAWAQRQKVDALIRLKRLGEAEKELITAQEVRPQPWITFNLAKVHFMNEQYEPAAKILETLLEQFPNFIKGFDLLAVCYQKMNKLVESHRVLQAGIKVSPKSFHRQKKFGDLCIRIDDFNGAVKAYKTVVKQAENTSHDTPDNYNLLIKSLKLQEEHEDVASNRARIRKELGRAVDKMISQYPNDVNVGVRAQIEKIDLAAQQMKENLLLKLYDQAEKKLDDIEQPTLLHVLQTFYNNDQTAVGNKWANALVEHFDGDDNFVIQVKDMLAEPISDADKEKARMLNKQAVTRYKNGEYLDAISMYQDAIEISPKHPGLVLNYTQALLQLANQNDDSINRLAIVDELLQRLDFLTDKHPSFERLQLLKGKYQALQEKFHG